MVLIASLTFDSPSLWPLAAAVGAVLTIVVAWLYPGQLRGAGIGRWVPPVLRWMAVAAIAVSLMKPVILEPKPVESQGAVVVLLDCSKSMSIVDPGRGPAERVALAGALGRLPFGVRSDVAASLGGSIDRVEARAREVTGAQSDLEYARVAGRGISERQRRLRETIDQYATAARDLASRAATLPESSELHRRLQEIANIPGGESKEAWSEGVRTQIDRIRAAAGAFQAAADEQLYRASPSVRATCDAMAKASRLDLAQEALLQPDTGLLARLGSREPVVGMAIRRGGITPITLASNGRPATTLPAAPNGDESDITGAVDAVVNGLDKRPVRAILLFSDGRQVGGRGDLASGVRPSGVPVFTIGVAADRAPDLSLASVSLPVSGAFAGEALEGEANVTDDGDLRAPQEIHISTSAGEQVERLVPRARRDRNEHGKEWSARFAVPIVPKDGAAAERIVFSVPPVPGEATTANNQVERWVKVVSSKLKVALCTATPTWDYQYLRDALARRVWVRLESQVLDPAQPRLGLAPGQILNQDVLILDDVPVTALDVNQWDAVRTLLMTRGGSVILIAGTAFPIADYAQQPIARTLLPFHDVRPVWKEWPGEQPAFHFLPTTLGEREALRLGPGASDNRRWQELPGVFRYLQVPDRNLSADAQPLLVESESGNAVLTERRLGAGRVLFFGLDETWRWRLKDGERQADQFWRQLVRHAGGEPYAVARGAFALDVDRVSATPGEPIHVRAKAPERRTGKGGPVATQPLDILQDQKVISQRGMTPAGGGHFNATIADLPPGDYTLQLPRAANAEPVRIPIHIADSDEAEMRDVSGDSERLNRIARATGGQYLPIDQVDRLPERLRALHETEAQFVRHPVWNSPVFFGFVLACFAGEWAMRKRLGLA